MGPLGPPYIGVSGPVHDTAAFWDHPTIVCETRRVCVHGRSPFVWDRPSRPFFQKRSVTQQRHRRLFLLPPGKSAAPTPRAGWSTIEQFRCRLEIEPENGSPSSRGHRAGPAANSQPAIRRRWPCPSRKCMKRGAESGKSTVFSFETAEDVGAAPLVAGRAGPRRNNH